MLVASSILLSVGAHVLSRLKNLFVSYWFDGTATDSEGEKLIVINCQKECESTLDEFGLRFWPPLYVQRYEAVQEVIKHPIWNGSIKKVADFGCSELSFFKYLKSIPGINTIMLVDVDLNTLDLNQSKIMPINYDYVMMNDRKEPLIVNIYNGSIADLDDRMLGLDAVVCIELIEHLYTDVLAAVPFTVFEFIKPKLAVFTTPNVEFNILFPNFTTKFRHDDHKFEWTRKQFQNWAHSITSKYTDYAVQFDGVGAGPPGNKNIGCCSQMAIFYRKDMNTSPADPVGSTPYKLLRQVNYPFEINDENTIKEKIIFQKLTQFVSAASSNKKYFVDSNMEIPLNRIMPYVSDCCSSVEHLQSYVRKLYHTEIDENGKWIMIKAISEYSSDESKSDLDPDSDSNHNEQEYSLLNDSVNSQHYEGDWSSSTGMHFGDSRLHYSTPMTKSQGIHASNANAESFSTVFSNSELYKTAVDYNKSNEDMEISSSCNSSLVIDDCKVYQDFASGRNSSGEDISEIEETMTCVPNSHETSKNSENEVNDNVSDDTTVVQNSSKKCLKNECSFDAIDEIKSQSGENVLNGTIKNDCKEIDSQTSLFLNRTLLDESGYTEYLLSTPNKTL